MNSLSVTSGTRPVLPPRGFRPAEGVRSAWSVGDGPFGRTPQPSKRRTAAQNAGLRYERKVKKLLGDTFGPEFRPGQWLRFFERSETTPRFCQVDGLLVRGNRAIIFECKYTFTSDAWFQLRQLYEPVVRKAFYADVVGLCVVCRVFDPAIAFPEETELLFDTELASWAGRDAFPKIGVLSWRGK